MTLERRVEEEKKKKRRKRKVSEENERKKIAVLPEISFTKKSLTHLTKLKLVKDSSFPSSIKTNHDNFSWLLLPAREKSLHKVSHCFVSFCDLFCCVCWFFCSLYFNFVAFFFPDTIICQFLTHLKGLLKST